MTVEEWFNLAPKKLSGIMWDENNEKWMLLPKLDEQGNLDDYRMVIIAMCILNPDNKDLADTLIERERNRIATQYPQFSKSLLS